MTFSDSFLHHGKIGTADKRGRVVEAAPMLVTAGFPA
jgi:hypothetical protein